MVGYGGIGTPIHIQAKIRIFKQVMLEDKLLPPKLNMPVLDYIHQHKKNLVPTKKFIEERKTILNKLYGTRLIYRITCEKELGQAGRIIISLSKTKKKVLLEVIVKMDDHIDFDYSEIDILNYFLVKLLLLKLQIWSLKSKIERYGGHSDFYVFEFYENDKYNLAIAEQDFDRKSKYAKVISLFKKIAIKYIKNSSLTGILKEKFH